MSVEKYISFDVGIVNLAYCLIEKSDNNFSIRKWGLFNLKDPATSCSMCKKPAQLYNEGANSEKTFWCKTHSKKYTKPVIVSTKILKEESKQNPCGNIMVKTQTICGKPGIESIGSCAYCKVHLTAQIKKENKKYELKSIKKINANHIPLQTLGVKLYQVLDSHPEFLDVREVLIENQPAKKNGTMKSVASFLYSYFILKGIANKQVNPIEKVKYICPGNKIKVSSSAVDKLKNMKLEIKELEPELDPEQDPEQDPEEDLEQEPSIKPKKKTKSTKQREIYIETKDMSVDICKELIKHDQVNLDLLNTYSKQDDMADSFLQAYYYLFCSNGVPDEVCEILNNLVANRKPKQSRKKKANVETKEQVNTKPKRQTRNKTNKAMVVLKQEIIV